MASPDDLLGLFMVRGGFWWSRNRKKQSRDQYSRGVDRKTRRETSRKITVKTKEETERGAKRNGEM